MKQKLLLLVFVFIINSAYGQNKEIMMPILQTPTNECFLAFTTGFDVNSWGDQDYCYFKSISVYNENSIVGNYTTDKGEYVSFHFVGGTNDSKTTNGVMIMDTRNITTTQNWDMSTTSIH